MELKRFIFLVSAGSFHFSSDYFRHMFLILLCHYRGGWVGCHLLSTPAFEKYSCLAIGHPSVSLEEWAFGRNVQALIDGVQRPVLFLPAKVPSHLFLFHLYLYLYLTL